MSGRKGDWLQTYTGAAFYPLDPRQDEIRFDDIAAALSKLCRYGGHCIRFYSVAEHCVHMASVAPDRWKLQALMHDAAEAYLIDLPRPIKRNIPAYSEIEIKLEKMIFERFGIEWPPSYAVAELDNRILTDERLQNMAPPPAPWNQNEQNEPLGVTLKFWTPAQAAYEFQTAFYRYGGRP
jgi:hypothetical protein